MNKNIIDSEPVNHYNINSRGSVNHWRRKIMSTSMKRFSVSVTPDLEKRLDTIKKELFYKKTQTQMLREVIKRGLDSFEHDNRIT